MELLALTGDFPCELLDRLPGCTDWSHKIVRELVHDKLVRRYKHDGIKSLRLTKKARTMLLASCYKRFHGLVDGAGEQRSRRTALQSRQRMHHIASVYVLLLGTNIAVHLDAKPPIFGEHQTYLGYQIVDWPGPCFYSSHEIKSTGSDLTRVKSARAAGVLISSWEDFYLVYHCGDSLMKWSSKLERKLAGVMEGVQVQYQAKVAEIKGIMAGDNMGTMLKLLSSTGGYRNLLYKVDDTFPALHFIPTDSDGKQLLKLLCSREAKLRLDYGLRRGTAPPGFIRFECDALVNTLPAIYACDLNLVKLKHFHDGLEQFEQKGHVLCFDFQADALKTYFGNLAEVHSLDSHVVWKEILNGN